MDGNSRQVGRGSRHDNQAGPSSGKPRDNNPARGNRREANGSYLAAAGVRGGGGREGAPHQPGSVPKPSHGHGHRGGGGGDVGHDWGARTRPSDAKRPREADQHPGGREERQPSKYRRADGGIREVVAAHYNNIQERSFGDRFKSTIIQMRSFNNWIKATLIGSVVDAVRSASWDADGEPVTVLELGVGKGGDLGKWCKHNISHLIGFDIAAESLACCSSRYRDMQKNPRRFQGTAFTAEFHEADFTRDKLSQMVDQPSKLPADIVNSQFSFHYCFESFAQADKTMSNVAECLRDGGYFLLTLPDAYNIVHRWKKSGASKFGNRIFGVDFGATPDAALPLFGATYRFSLEGVIDCPEFLVYFPALVDLAARHGLKLLYKKTFRQIFDEHGGTPSGKGLLRKMSALESYPSGNQNQRQLEGLGEFDHAKALIERVIEQTDGGTDQRPSPVVGTLSKAEWEAASLYCAAVFVKNSDPVD